MNKQDYVDYEYELDIARARIPMTLSQLRDPRYTDVNRNIVGYIERKGQKSEACIIGMSMPGIYGVQEANGRMTFHFAKEYNKLWRIWRLPPTEEMREFPWREEI